MALQGLPQRFLHQFILCGTLQNACSTSPRVVAGLGKGARMHTVRLMNSRAKRSKKNDDKSAVVEAWHPSRVRSRGDLLYTQLVGHTTIGLRLSRHGAAEVFIDFTEELRHAETNPTCSIHKSRRTSRRNSRPKSFARNDLSRWTSSA